MIRVIQGLVSGLAFPSTYNLFGKWSSPEERATIMSVVFSGIPVAIIVNFPLSSALCESGIDGGWPMVFYIPGSTPCPSMHVNDAKYNKQFACNFNTMGILFLKDVLILIKVYGHFTYKILL